MSEQVAPYPVATASEMACRDACLAALDCVQVVVERLGAVSKREALVCVAVCLHQR